MYRAFETSLAATGMTITVNEALRLKNEISNLLNSVQNIANRSHLFGDQSRIEYGELFEDGLRVEKPRGVTFENFKDRYYALLNYSNEINTEIARFNAENDIGFLVRLRSNLTDVEKLLLQAAAESKAYDRSRSNYVEGIGRVEIKSTFEPFSSEDEYVAQARAVRDGIRGADNDIARLNGADIELSFSFGDVDDIKAFFKL